MIEVRPTTGRDDVCTVIVTVDADTDFMPALRHHARMGLDQFPSYPGYLSGALHLSDDGTRLVQYLQWRSETDYRACVEDSAWDRFPSTAVFLEAASAGEARVDARVFVVVEVGPPGSSV